MAYHEEDKIALLIANFVRWSGDNPLRGTSQLWIEEKIAMRDLRLDFRSNFGVFEAIGVEAQLTKDTLAAMLAQLRFALLTFHLSSLTFDMQARDIVEVSKSTYHRRLVLAHLVFMEAYELQEELARERSAAYVRMVNQAA